MPVAVAAVVVGEEEEEVVVVEGNGGVEEVVEEEVVVVGAVRRSGLGGLMIFGGRSVGVVGRLYTVGRMMGGET